MNADNLTREMEAEQAAEKRRVIDAINELATIAEVTKPIDAREKLLREQVRDYMALNGFEVLEDGETGVRAKFQDRTGQPLYDLVSAAHVGHGTLAILDAAKAGMLRVDAQMLKRFRSGSGATWADVLEGYAMPGPQTTALIIEKGDR